MKKEKLKFEYENKIKSIINEYENKLKNKENELDKIINNLNIQI
jgi:hypothetical protein